VSRLGRGKRHRHRAVYFDAARIRFPLSVTAPVRAKTRPVTLAPDPNLESEVREEAERQLTQAALQDGILKTAADNARSTISGMLKGFGFHETDFR